MPAFLKLYTDAGHTAEVAHTTDHTATLNGLHAAGATTLTLTGSLAGWPTAGTLDIIDGANGNETLAYTSISGQVVTLAKATATSHANGLTVNQWFYSLAIGDQTNGISNDGTNSTPNSPTNVASWYVYNAGDQTAQGTAVATSNAAPSTTQGFADTEISKTSAATGFATSQALGDLTAGAAPTQVWVAALVPNNQSIVGNPQLCVLTLSYQTV
jgi:hypothetical protein